MKVVTKAGEVVPGEETPEEIEAAIAAQVSDSLNADIYLYAGEMQFPNDRRFSKCVQDNRSRKNAALYLATMGGSADAAYRVARCLQGAYPDGLISLNVLEFCKSAGTLITIGASEVVMGEDAELGPLDVQIAKHDTLTERTSGLTPVQSLATLREETFKFFEKNFLDVIRRSGGRISTRSASLSAVQMTAGLFRPIFAQIDPMKLGEYGRSLLVANDYGQRLNKRFKNLKPDGLTQLVAGYPSHEFVIDRTEAATLFSAVRSPTAMEEALAMMLNKEVWECLGASEKRRTVKIRCLTKKIERKPDEEPGDDTIRVPIRVPSRVTPPAAGRKPGAAATKGRSDARPLSNGRRRAPESAHSAEGNGVPT